jgi:hypothetical protein
MVMHINEAQHLLPTIGDQLLHCGYFWYQHLFYVVTIVVIPPLLHIQAIQVFSDQRGAVVASIDTIRVYHRHYFKG